MYNISVPINTALITKETKPKYLKLLKEAKAERVLLIALSMNSDLAQQQQEFLSIKAAAEFFEENGITPAVWLGRTIGHGVPLSGVELSGTDDALQPLVNLSGTIIGDTCCPLDERMRKQTGEFIARLAENTGVKLIYLDDDFRLSQHGDDFCCACPLHMARISEISGESITRERLKQLVFKEKSNKYRRAWLQAQRESLELLAADIRKEVDKLTPDASVAICVAHSIFGADGSSATDIAKLLAGNNKAYARLHPAPYSVVQGGVPMTTVFELARMFAFFSKNKGVEIIAEGDTYPRPRYYTPATYLEIFDALIRADGTYDGCLKYMVDYFSNVDYEPGYIELHKHNLPVMEQITEEFCNGSTCGIYAYADKNVMEMADFSLSDAYANNYPFPTAAVMLAGLGIPTAFEDNGGCVALFGEHAHTFPLERLEKGALLDGVSAKILSDSGIDTGITQFNGFKTGAAEAVYCNNDRYLVSMYGDNTVRMLDCTLNDAALVTAKIEVSGKTVPLIYRYRNSSGQRFTVYLGDCTYLKNNSTLLKSYYLQDQFIEGIEYIGYKLPVSIRHQSGVYLLVKAYEGKMKVGIFNTGMDTVLKPCLHLDKSYKKISFINTAGTLSSDTVTLNTLIPPLGFCAFTVE